MTPTSGTGNPGPSALPEKSRPRREESIVHASEQLHARWTLWQTSARAAPNPCLPALSGLASAPSDPHRAVGMSGP
eukprot:10537316-Alexandrium_andersonii.AAC.1